MLDLSRLSSANVTMPRQSTLGSATDSWRASQARHQIGQTSVAKYMARRRGPPSQGWKAFLRNHADGIAAMDLFVVPTISFRLLYGLLIMGHGRRQVLWFGVTAHPTAEWMRKSNHASVRLKAGPSLSDPRSGRGLWRSLYSKSSIHGHSRSTDVAAFPMAKRMC